MVNDENPRCKVQFILVLPESRCESREASTGTSGRLLNNTRMDLSWDGSKYSSHLFHPASTIGNLRRVKTERENVRTDCSHQMTINVKE